MLNFRTTDDQRAYAKDRRDMLRAANRCICGPLVGFVSRNGTVHGVPVKRGRCQRCLDAAKGTRKLMPSIRDVVEAHKHLSLCSHADRERLIHALENRRGVKPPNN